MRRVRREDMSNQEEIEDELESQQIVTGNKRVVPSTRKKRRGMIEKRRRDKINHSLAELRRLVPAAFEKQGSAKLEKAEILQMTVDYLTMLHAKGIVGGLDNNKYIPLQSINDQLSSSPSNQAQQNTPNLMLNQSQAQNLNINHNNHHHQQQQHDQQQQQPQTTLQSQTNSLQNNILQNQPIDHNNHAQQQRQNLLDSSSAHVSNAATAAAMLSVVPSPSSAVQSSPFASAASASHHLYNQHHMSASAAAAYHQLNNPLGNADMTSNLSDSTKHSIKMDPHQPSLVIQHPHHHHASLLNLDYQHHQAHPHHNPLCTHYGSHHHHHHHSGASLTMSPYTTQN